MKLFLGYVRVSELFSVMENNGNQRNKVGLIENNVDKFYLILLISFSYLMFK